MEQSRLAFQDWFCPSVVLLCNFQFFRIVEHLIATHPSLQNCCCRDWDSKKSPPVHLSASEFVQLLPLDSLLDSCARLKKAAWFLLPALLYLGTLDCHVNIWSRTKSCPLASDSRWVIFTGNQSHGHLCEGRCHCHEYCCQGTEENPN